MLLVLVNCSAPYPAFPLVSTVEPVNTVTNGSKQFGHVNGVAVLQGQGQTS